MIVNKERFKLGIMEAVAVIASLVMLIGLKLWFPVCPVMEDKIMACHWAGNMLMGIVSLILAMSLVKIFIPDLKVKLGMTISSVIVSFMPFLIPGILIGVCKMEDMACRRGTQPAARVFSVVMILIFVIDLVTIISAIRKAKHARR